VSESKEARGAAKSELGAAATQIGPLISPTAKQRVESLIQSAVDEGISARVLHARRSRVSVALACAACMVGRQT
jgi:acyl-CoA reductase-like NAD-dependent aldehyde dehydrogenase